MINVKYISASNNPSGYGSAARQFITALFIAGINLTCETISQMPENTSYGISGKIREGLENRDIDYKIVIIHLTPDLYPDYTEGDKYIIGHLFWECSKLPKEWIKPLNSINEIWTASKEMAEMIRQSGVKTPCFTFPQPIDITKAYENIKPFGLDYEKGFTFYSIFQWIARKNPEVLLKAYWKEFQDLEDVCLILKTYRITYLEPEFNFIKSDIKQWKNELGLKKYPKIYLASKLLTDNEIYRLHAMGDCYVNSSSGEGWSRPMQEAMLMGNPVISGNNGGITDIMSEDYYYQVQSKYVQATEQPFIPWYTKDMSWKVLSEEDLRKKMRLVYTQQKKYKGMSAKKYIIDQFSYSKVGGLMKERLGNIYRSL